MKLWALHTAKSVTIISRLKEPFGILGEESISRNMQLDIPMVFKKNICWYLLRSRVSRELPLEIAELCIEPKVSQEQLVFAGELKARRCSSHRKALTSSSVTQELSHKKPRKEFLEDVFRRVELRA